jgi:hypothetical protein
VKHQSATDRRIEARSQESLGLLRLAQRTLLLIILDTTLSTDLTNKAEPSHEGKTVQASLLGLDIQEGIESR